MFKNTDAFNTMPVGWDTSKVTASGSMFTSADTWTARFTGGGTSTLPGSEWTRIEDACDASYPPLNGDVGNCTDTLMSGTSCVPTCGPYYVLEGVTSCTDRVLTEVAVCTLDVTTRAELKAAVDACVGDRLCELTMPHWDVSRVTDMSFLFQGKTQFNVNIGQWEMSQVTTAAGMFQGASSFYRDISGWTFADNADTTGMFSGADTWLSRISRDDTVNTKDGPPGAWVFNPCLENERVENGLCAPCTHGGTNAAGDDPAAGDTGCAFPDRAALKTAVDNCLAVDPTGVACCSHGADCGAAGTAEMPDWDVSLVTDMSELFKDKADFNVDISAWDTSQVTNMRQMFRLASTFNQDIGSWSTSKVTDMRKMFGGATDFYQDITGWSTTSLIDSTEMFAGATAWLDRVQRGDGTGTSTDGPISEWVHKPCLREELSLIHI